MQTKATWQALILNITILLFFMLSCSRCNLHEQAICDNGERFSNKWQGTPNISYNFQSYFVVSWNLLGKKKKCLFVFSYLINIFVLILFAFSRNKNTRKFFLTTLHYHDFWINWMLHSSKYFILSRLLDGFICFYFEIQSIEHTPRVEKGKILLGC